MQTSVTDIPAIRSHRDIVTTYELQQFAVDHFLSKGVVRLVLKSRSVV